jgi:hypothetical protein
MRQIRFQFLQKPTSTFSIALPNLNPLELCVSSNLNLKNHQNVTQYLKFQVIQCHSLFPRYRTLHSLMMMTLQFLYLTLHLALLASLMILPDLPTRKLIPMFQ